MPTEVRLIRLGRPTIELHGDDGREPGVFEPLRQAAGTGEQVRDE
jgi:hypothetical protein